MSLEPYIHPSACIDKPCEIGLGTKIWHFSHVMSGAQIGRDCILGQNVFVGSGVKIGDRVKVQNNVSVYTGVTLEDGVFCGPSVVFTNVNNPRATVPRNTEEHRALTLVKQGATVGANATIVCGVTIGRYAFIGAGSVVTDDVAEYSQVVGNPARPLGWRCSCGEKLKFAQKNAECLACGFAYRLQNDLVSKLSSD